MADKVKQSYQLKLVAGFADGDERTISYDNPKPNVTAAEIIALNDLAKGVLIGDKYGAEFSIFKDAEIVTTTQIDLDLTPEP